MFFDMKVKNTYKDFYDSLNEVEKEKLEKLIKRFPNKKMRFERSYSSGIGISSSVFIDDKEYDITDYECW